MTSLGQLASEFAITVSDGEVWLSIGLALLLGSACLLFGTWVARTVGLLAGNAPAGEMLGVGLASGLIVFSAWWAAIWSGGRSSFTPVAVGFALAIGLAFIARTRRPSLETTVSIADRDDPAKRRRSGILTAVAGGAFVVVVGLLYGSTMAPSPRDGVQPVEFTDEAFYSVLGRDLAETGTETSLGPSGFSDLPGFPAQVWYHWAEIWVASAVITIFGTAPLAARHFVVLPLALLAAAAMTGTLVRQLAPTFSRRAYVFGFLACLFLAPVEVGAIAFFSASNVGMIFGITTYGLAAVAVLLAIRAAVDVNLWKMTWGLALFVGCVVAYILPSHIAVALLAVVGGGAVVARRSLWALYKTHRLPVVSIGWRLVIVAATFTLVATLVWGLLTGHSQGSDAGPGPALVSPFNQSWRGYVVATILGGGAFFVIGVAWFLAPRELGVQPDLYLGTLTVLLAGAIAWGSRLHQFTMFHFFFGAIAVFATPVAAVAIRTVWSRLRAKNYRLLAAGLVAVTVIQLEIGAVNVLNRLQSFGPHEHEPIPVAILSAIEDLTPGAKLAYACGEFEEIGFATPALLSIDAHTGHRVVPLCFAAERLSGIIGAGSLEGVPSLFYEGAPQRALYPNAAANPSPAAIAAFLRQHGIDYIYADSKHPNVLLADARPIAAIGGSSLLKVPSPPEAGDAVVR